MVSAASLWLLHRWSRWGLILGRFATVQVLVQSLNALTGLLYIRALDKQDYALFTIASSIQTTFNLISDCGINAGILSAGGRLWQDRGALGMLVATAMRLRLQLIAVAIVLVTPLEVWLLIRNGATILQAILLTAVVIATAHFISTAAVLGVVTRLHSRYREIQQVELTGAGFRLGLGAMTALIFANAIVAAVCNGIAQLLQAILVRRQVRTLIPMHQQIDSGFRTDLLSVVHRQAFYFFFYAFQGQVGILLMGVFGGATQVADLGALSRLAILTTVIGAIINHVVSPAFARIRERRHLRRVVAEIMTGTILWGLSSITLAIFFGKQILWVFGASYSHLERELVWVMVSIALGVILAVLWALNTARGWLGSTWIMVPFTLAVQALLLRWLDLTSVHGIIQFGLLSQMPNLLVSAVMAVKGFRNFDRSGMAGNTLERILS